MSPFWLTVFSVCSAAILLLSGCIPRDPPASGSVPGDIFLAASQLTTINNKLSVQVHNDIGGDVSIIVGRGEEVAADAIVIGNGGALEKARVEAQEHTTLTNHVTLVQLARQQDISAQDSALLHVRVPPGANITDVRTQNGELGVYGASGDVTATISGKGDIEVLGGNGNMNLNTENGSITADLMPGDKSLNVQAKNGNIDLMATNALVSAATTGGRVRFVGTLRSDRPNSFTTTAGGNVTVAIPAHPKDPQGKVLSYRVYASTAANSIIMDYPPDKADKSTGALAICGIIFSPGPYDYHVENTQARFGRLEINPVLTTTYFFSGTLTPTYYRFETNQPRLSMFAPRTQAIHIYTAADVAQIAAGKLRADPDCEEALKVDPNQLTAVVLTLGSGTGRIFLHHIDFTE